MAENTAIEWCDHTFNPWQGCTKVSPGCDHCYAEARQDKRLHVVQWGAGQERKRTSPHNWRTPLTWNRKHEAFFAAHGRRQRVFCASLADVFDNEVPRQWRQDLFDLILATPNLDWLLLTKRIGNARRMLEEIAVARSALLTANDTYRPPGNVWLGATIVDQAEADRDIPKLLATPARVRFLSMEPLLGRVDLEKPMPGPDLYQGGGATICQPWYIQSGISWVIVGGESGHGARPMHPDWARSLRDQCAAAGVPFLFKQWGEWASTWHARIDPALAEGKPYVHVTPMCREDGTNMSAPNYQLDRVGKKAAGRRLDGRTHDAFPEVEESPK